MVQFKGFITWRTVVYKNFIVCVRKVLYIDTYIHGYRGKTTNTMHRWIEQGCKQETNKWSIKSDRDDKLTLAIVPNAFCIAFNSVS